MRKTLLFLCILAGSFGWAQQTGSISGYVVASNGEGLPGVTISATGDVLPQPRSTISQASGSYRLTALPPGNYQVTFTMAGFGTVKANVVVRLQGDTDLPVVMNTETTEEVMTVQGALPLISKTSTEIKASFDDEVFKELPLGEEYRDMMRMIPGVQVTEDSIRGPSAGGSGQDNSYKFDGVDVTLPMFGTLSSEPSSHDIAQVAVVKGGAQAVNYNRSGGITVNTISKSGTNEFKGEISFKMQADSWSAKEERETVSALVGETDRSWLTASLGGPVYRDRLYFFVSYYAPEYERSNRSNSYGDLKDGESDRDEYFFKFTFSPTDSLTLHASYRDSSRDSYRLNYYANSAPTVSSSNKADQTITILEGDWILTNNASMSFKYTSYDLDTFGGPDQILSVKPSDAADATIDIDNINMMGSVSLANLRDADEYGLFNQYMAPILEKYGWLDTTTGQYMAGTVGAYSTINDQDFQRESFQVSYDHYAAFGYSEHTFHIGFKTSLDEEDLYRDRNGWGYVSFLYSDFQGMPAGDYSYEELAGIPFIQAEYLRKSDAGNNSIVHSEYKAMNIELNDNIEWGDWNFNIGVLLSKDTLYGQDLKNDSNALSGFVESLGSKYEMYEIDWDKMIQPRLGALYRINETDTAAFSYAKYNPVASSLPRAASWARNYHLLRTRAFFNVFGEIIPDLTYDRSSSSGKLFVPDMTPRGIDEYMVSYNKQLPDGWTGKFNARYRKASHFWEDTNNNARSRFGDSANLEGNSAEPPSNTDDYIPELNAYREQIGSGSSYVIAELDGAFTKFYEVGANIEKRTADWYLNASYTWSHYYGNFDQDNTAYNNDLNIFIGSSIIADGAGRQIWDFKYGNLRGDRRHLLKLLGKYNLFWNATVGANLFYQSGQPWETWNVDVYREWTGSSSSTYRFAEPAGSRTSDAHYQVDLTYTQRFTFAERYNFELKVDIYNLTDNQTGYNINPYYSSSTYGEPRSYYAPRRFKLTAAFKF
ncbi:MAG: TonB-dependent receptor [Acidobacteria bacterium]|nr:MAG: TonB-dependent receptor [Acidobacteriota bacterium]